MKYPEYALVDGKKYKINTSYKTALKCFSIIDDDSIGDQERTLAIIYKLFGFVPTENIDVFLQKASYFLRCGIEQEEHQKRTRDMDFEQDEKYIMASFISDYHIDLSKADMHWWQYIQLIEGLTDKCILSRIREIRTYDLSEIKDIKFRNKIIKAQENVKLKEKRTNEEEMLIDEFESLF